MLRNIIQQTTLGNKSFSYIQRGVEEVKEGGDEEPTNLLITLDALGTLYEIKNGDLGQEYTQVAKECGVKGLLAGDVAKSFKEAFKELSASHPNYGYATGMKPKEWWEQVTIKTFKPLIPFPVPFPPNLAESLWTHFSSNAAYSIFPGTMPFLWNIKDLKGLATRTRKGQAGWKFRTITIGIISNSDDRIIDVLTSMGIHATHRAISLDGGLDHLPPKSFSKKGKELYKSLKGAGVASRASRRAIRKISETKNEVLGNDQVVDFVATSCGLGVAKPQREIFETAKKAAARLIAMRFGEEEAEKGWEWYHVGDNRREDVVGAYEAGGVGILLDRNKEIGETETIVEGTEEGVGYKTMVVGDLREVAEFTEGLSILYKAGGEKVPYASPRG